jgi:hypothetical protein
MADELKRFTGHIKLTGRGEVFSVFFSIYIHSPVEPRQFRISLLNIAHFQGLKFSKLIYTLLHFKFRPLT